MLMDFKIVTDVTAEPVTPAEARLQCKLTDSDTSVEDGLIGDWITAAREAAEHHTGRTLAPKTVEIALDAFPSGSDEILLPLSPVNSITSIKYIDANGVEQTLASNQYTLDVYGDSRVIVANYGCLWPVTRVQANAVKIVAAVGYASAPRAAKAAMLLTIAHLFEHRSAVIADARAVAVELPQGAQALLDTVTIWSV